MKRVLITFVCAFMPLLALAQVELSALRTNSLDTPIGIDPEGKLSFSWIATSQNKGASQISYEVTLYRGKTRVWGSGKVKSDNSIAVECDARLYSNTKYMWTVRVWDNTGRASKRYSSWFHTGIKQSEWVAEWIGEKGYKRPINLRYQTKLSKPIRRAMALFTSHGGYEAYINGARVGDLYMTPGWTSYLKRLQYQMYDVTSMLQQGDNVVAAVVAPGWYSSMGYGAPERRTQYGDDIALLGQIMVEYTDGTSDVIATSDDWYISTSAKASGVVFNHIYDGETIDARLIDDRWSTTSYKMGKEWSKAAQLNLSKSTLVASVSEPVKAHTPIKPIKYIVTPKGEKVIDFGQNIVGWERVRLQGAKGAEIRIYHAETLDEKGNFYTVNLRSAKALSTYIMDGGAKREFVPSMTFYGFRYIKVEGVEGDLNLADFEAVPVWSAFDNVGSFSCSNPIINQLQSNIWWSFHDNFLDVPTDCPQRDERLGWTGDAQIFFRTASFLGRVENFFAKWLADVEADQKEDGRLPRIVPDVYREQTRRLDACGWADAITIIPWQHYIAYGDKSILEDQYASMKKWVDYLIKQSKDNGWIWNRGSHYGDWLFYSVNNDRDGISAVTSKYLIAQCFYAHSADNVARAAEVLGKVADMAYYRDVAKRVREAYLNEYVTPNGLISGDTQTAYVLALKFDMLPEHMRKSAAKRLVENIKRYKYHITTGFLGTPYICEVLTQYGYSDVAYRLLLQEGCPGWLFQVKMGATTIWERWDSIREDGSIPNNGMNSLNHYSYGSIGDWLYRSAVGLYEAAPAYKRIVVKPHTGGNFEHMEASTITPYGKAAAGWKAKDNILTELSVEIPFNTTAEIYVPAKGVEAVQCDDASIVAAGYVDGYVKFSVGSGKYTFSVK